MESRRYTVRVALVVVLAFALLVGVTACGGGEDPVDDAEVTDPAAPEGDAGEGTDDEVTDGAADESDPAVILVETKCSMCHTLDRVWSADYDRAGWESTIDRMKAQGLVITDEEYETVVEHLSTR